MPPEGDGSAEPFAPPRRTVVPRVREVETRLIVTFRVGEALPHIIHTALHGRGGVV